MVEITSKATNMKIVTAPTYKGCITYKGVATSYEDMRKQLKEAKLKFRAKAVFITDNKPPEIHFIATDGGISNTLGIDLSGDRRTGKTVRQIDEAIRILFEEGAVEVKDHYEMGSYAAANKLLFGRVIKRLQAEHQHAFINYIKYDTRECIIKLQNPND